MGVHRLSGLIRAGKQGSVLLGLMMWMDRWMKWEGRIWLLQLSSLQDKVFKELKQLSSVFKLKLSFKSDSHYIWIFLFWWKYSIYLSSQLALLCFNDLHIALFPKRIFCLSHGQQTVSDAINYSFLSLWQLSGRMVAKLLSLKSGDGGLNDLWHFNWCPSLKWNKK